MLSATLAFMLTCLGAATAGNLRLARMAREAAGPPAHNVAYWKKTPWRGGRDGAAHDRAESARLMMLGIARDDA